MHTAAELQKLVMPVAANIIYKFIPALIPSKKSYLVKCPRRQCLKGKMMPAEKRHNLLTVILNRNFQSNFAFQLGSKNFQITFHNNFFTN